MLKVGKYVILKPNYWVRDDCKIINVIEVDGKYIKYTYEDNHNFIRQRSLEDFDLIDIVEMSSLLKELL